MPAAQPTKTHQSADVQARLLHHAEDRASQLESKLRATEEKLETSTREHKRHMARATDEARRWKQAHDDMHASARELAYKTTVANTKLQESQAKHKNLYENHTAMQSKYQALKKAMKEMQAETENQATKVDSDWQKNAAKWKQRCQGAVNKYEALSQETLKKMSEHAAEVQAVKARAAKDNADLSAKLQTLRKEYAQLEADHRVSCSDNARFHTELSRAKASDKALTQENAQLLSRIQQAAQDTAELAALKHEMPAVKARLAKVASLTEQVASLSSAKQKLGAELAELRQAQENSQTKHKAAVAKALADGQAKSAAELAATRARVDSAEEGLRAARKAISDNALREQQLLKSTETLKSDAQRHVSSLRNCRHMLENAHKVLSVCTEVHAKNDLPDTPLFAALSEATDTIGKFLRTPSSH